MTHTLYYVDGYHGGTRGHMPVGAWRDVLSKLRALPNWKLVIDVEPDSWRRVRAEDPEAYAELCRYFAEPPENARVELINGSFTQPFGWAMSGESNIRQLLRGLEVNRHHFPNVVVNTFATQEPCWASFFPQVLVSLGYTGAVLKNSTMWGGYTFGVDAELLNWVGPDGTSLPAVPKYDCEALRDTWWTMGSTGSVEYMETCIAHGIPHPTGVFIQDLGWGAKPWVSGDHIKHVTWREYIAKIAETPSRDWRFSPEDIRCTLPWGEKTIQRIAVQVRSAENRIVVTEKLAAMASVWSKAPYPIEKLTHAWNQLFWAQHHDAWITATTRFGRDAWAWQVASETWDVEQICDDIMERSTYVGDSMTVGTHAVQVPERRLRVYNTLGHDREDIVEIAVPTDPGTVGVTVKDGAGNIVPSQFSLTRKYLNPSSDVTDGRNRRGELAEGESIAAGKLVFNAAVPAMGYSTYTMETVAEEVSVRQSGAERPTVPHSTDVALAVPYDDGSVAIETDLYRVRIDAKLGGSISSLYTKQLQKEFCGTDARRFNEYRGYFIEEEAWRSSTETPATVKVLENGPVRVSVAIDGHVSNVAFRTVVTAVQGQRRIDFSTHFRYDKETWIGDPWDLKPEDMRHDHKSHHDDRYKLLASFPVPFKDQVIYKNAAFDVCRSTNVDTFFQGWSEIKHNIIVNWVDVASESENYGLAVFSNHTTSYAHGEGHPLSLVMGWGWQAGFWWGKCALSGTQEVKYSLIPHDGLWDKGRLWEESTRIAEPLTAAPIPTGLKAGPDTRSLVRVETPGVELASVVVDGNDLLLRIFNAESDSDTVEISFESAPKSAAVVELDGRVRETLKVGKLDGGRYGVKLTVNRFGIRTLRVGMALG